MRDEDDAPHDCGSECEYVYGAGGHVLGCLGYGMQLGAREVDGVFDGGVKALAANDQTAADEDCAPFPRSERKREPQNEDEDGNGRLNANVEPRAIRL